MGRVIPQCPSPLSGGLVQVYHYQLMFVSRSQVSPPWSPPPLLPVSTRPHHQPLMRLQCLVGRIRSRISHPRHSDYTTALAWSLVVGRASGG
ncbi:hypothetical protein EDB86DRAFT_3088246 [Lactarius hatsudake]|nr:hypothetical protein EDB86DRAFT_3088246 [Lactarius hatsudake]